MGNESENLQQVKKQENGEERNISISNDETETNVTHENDQELSDGEHISFQLGSQAKIDAVVDMPDKKWNEFEKCVIEVDGFQGESVFNKILGKSRKVDWKQEKETQESRMFVIRMREYLANN